MEPKASAHYVVGRSEHGHVCESLLNKGRTHENGIWQECTLLGTLTRHAVIPSRAKRAATLPLMPRPAPTTSATARRVVAISVAVSARGCKRL